MSFLDFNSMLLDISNKLSSKELEEMKFLCREIIGKKNMEQINSALNLFQFLSERGKLAADRTEFLSKLLKDIQRPGLSEIVENFQGSPDDQLESTERGNEAEKRAALDFFKLYPSHSALFVCIKVLRILFCGPLYQLHDLHVNCINYTALIVLGFFEKQSLHVNILCFSRDSTLFLSLFNQNSWLILYNDSKP